MALFSREDCKLLKAAKEAGHAYAWIVPAGKQGKPGETRGSMDASKVRAVGSREDMEALGMYNRTSGTRGDGDVQLIALIQYD